jgi:hypothetical protein
VVKFVYISFIFLLQITALSRVEARVFKLTDESFATYLQGAVGPSLIQKSSYERSDVTFSNKVEYNLSGEVGVLFTVSRTNLKLGLEIIRPQAITGAQALGEGEVPYYRVTSGIISYGPTIGFDFLLGASPHFRFFVSASLGYMKTTLKNDYAFTSEGQTRYGLIDYTEEGSAYSVMTRGGLGVEFSFSDNVTMALDAGYRSLVATGLQHERVAITLGGPVSIGHTMKDENGADRKVDLSGATMGVGLRFYFQ